MQNCNLKGKSLVIFFLLIFRLLTSSQMLLVDIDSSAVLPNQTTCRAVNTYMVGVIGLSTTRHYLQQKVQASQQEVLMQSMEVVGVFTHYASDISAYANQQCVLSSSASLVVLTVPLWTCKTISSQTWVDPCVWLYKNPRTSLLKFYQRDRSSCRTWSLLFIQLSSWAQASPNLVIDLSDAWSSSFSPSSRVIRTILLQTHHWFIAEIGQGSSSW